MEICRFLQKRVWHWQCSINLQKFNAKFYFSVCRYQNIWPILVNCQPISIYQPPYSHKRLKKLPKSFFSVLLLNFQRVTAHFLQLKIYFTLFCTKTFNFCLRQAVLRFFHFEAKTSFLGCSSTQQGRKTLNISEYTTQKLFHVWCNWFFKSSAKTIISYIQ